MGVAPYEFIVLLIPLVRFIIPVVIILWAVISLVRAQRRSVEERAASNALVIEHLRQVSQRLDRIEAALNDVPD